MNAFLAMLLWLSIWTCGCMLSGCADYNTSVSLGYKDATAKLTFKPAKNDK